MNKLSKEIRSNLECSTFKRLEELSYTRYYDTWSYFYLSIKILDDGCTIRYCM